MFYFMRIYIDRHCWHANIWNLSVKHDLVGNILLTIYFIFMQIGQFQFKFCLDIISSQNDGDIIASEIDGLVQECSNAICNALELLQPSTKPSK